MPVRSPAARLAGRLADPGPPDAELVGRFADRADGDAAFAELVRRHGPMVHAVCRRVLGRAADADDAFQATFLVLVRKARQVRDRAAVGNWLYGVAHRTAVHLKARAARRRPVPLDLDAMPAPRPADPSDLLPVLDEELARLPDRLRAVVVLCELEGQTLAAAAKALGVPAGTAASRLSRARRLLADRLAARGLPVTVAAVAAALGGAAQARLPPALLRSAAGLAADPAAATPPVHELSCEVMKMLFVAKLKLLSRAGLACAGLTAAAAALLGSASAGPVPRPAAPTMPVAAPVPEAGPPAAKHEALWADLAHTGPAAVKAGIGFAATPKESTAFLKTKLRRVPADVAAVVKAGAADLESDDPKVREKAAAELRFVAPLAETELIAAEAAATAAVAKQTLDQLIGEARGEFEMTMDNGAFRVTRVVFDIVPAAGPRNAPVRNNVAMAPSATNHHGPAEWRQMTHAVGVLEAFGTPEAVAVIKDLAGGHASALPAIHAKAALDRLAERSAR